MSYNQPNTADESTVFPLNSGQRVAVIFTSMIGSISTTCVTLLLTHLFSVSFVSGRAKANKDERIFLRMHLGAFVVCLLCSDLVQGISGIMQLEWARTREVRHGPLCTAQAAMIMFGDIGTAFWSAAVAVHTFWTVVLRKRMSTVAVALIITTGWTMSAILTAIGPIAIQTPERGPFYSIAGAWCFVTTEYKNDRIYLHYIPMLLSCFTITILYLLVALVLFGILIVDGKRWRLNAPRTAGIRGLIDQFSWGRIGRGYNIRGNQIQSDHSSGIKSLTGRIRAGSTRPAGVGCKSTEVKPGDDLAGDNMQTIDIGPLQARPESYPAMIDSASPPHALDRGRSSDPKTLSEPKGLSKEGRVKVPVVAVPVVAMPVTSHIQSTVQVSAKGVPLKQLAVKMLWYPIVYLFLVMPITVTRVDTSLNVELSVMIGFMCLLWSMGTANTIIYICTRRLGPNPWSRQLSLSRSRSKNPRKREPSPAAEGMQIRVDRFTHHATDDQFILSTSEKGLRNSLTIGNISLSDSAQSPPAHEVAFGFNGLPHTTHHVLQHQQPQQTTAFSPPTSPQSQYSQAQSPQVREPRTFYPAYYFEHDDDSLRTQSRTRSGSYSLHNDGGPMAL